MAEKPPTEKTDAPGAAQVVQEIARQFRAEVERQFDRFKAERRAIDEKLVAELEKLNVRRSELDARIARRLAEVDAHIERLADDRTPGETRFTPERPQ